MPSPSPPGGAPPSPGGETREQTRARLESVLPSSPTGSAGKRPVYHSIPPGEMLRHADTTLDGLSDEEAARRLAQHGPNQLAEVPPPPVWKKFVDQISDFTVLALLAAALIAGLLAHFFPEEGTPFVQRYGDSLAILAIVILNAVLGLVQQSRAERALHALRNMTAPTARALRSNTVKDVAAADLVPGDLILLEEGDRVPADLRLVATNHLEVEEAALTGEALPVQKNAEAALADDAALAERLTMAFMGTQVARGRGRGVVTATGMGTELGSIAGMLARVEDEETPLEQDLDRFGKQVVIGCVLVSLLVFAAGMFMAWHRGADLFVEARLLFLVAVALAVAAIPEGLPAITTIVLALGTQRMAKRNALVRRLPAVETLGCTQVICTDKTGTLTQNRMTARRMWIAGALYQTTPGASAGSALPTPDSDPNDLESIRAKTIRPLDQGAAIGDVRLALRAAAHATGARLVAKTDGGVEPHGDPTDGAILLMAWSGGEADYRPLISEQPFTSERRMASVVVQEEKEARSYVRGAPEAVLARSVSYRNGGKQPLTDEARRDILAEAERWSSEAMRVIALAYKNGSDDPESGLTFLALIGIVDPPREGVAEAIAAARTAGIATIMITGDHPATGKAIAKEIDLWREGDLVLSGPELELMDQASLVDKVDHLRVVARATAAHKLRIVEALKARGRICAMTGDGVNDAPAVKSASIGIAMGRTGTDVTKEAADLVLADDNYATIIAAVEEGRAIYSNIRKFIFFLLSSNAGIVIMVLAASLLGWPQPLAPIQILWINLITNGLPALALGIDHRDPEQMHLPPRAPGGAVLSKGEYVEVVVVGVIMAITAMAAFHHLRITAATGPDSPLAVERARTVCYAILALGPLLHAFNCRSKTKSLFSLGVFTNRALWISVGIGVVLAATTIWVPAFRALFKTGPVDEVGLLWIVSMSLFPFIAGELIKLVGGFPSAKEGAF